MTTTDRIKTIWRKHRLKLMGGGVLVWVLFMTFKYLDVKRDQRSAPAGAKELLQIGALPVT
jgi:hypothetical protein